MAGVLPIVANTDKVNIVHYDRKLYACCRPCRTKSESGRDDYELVRQGSLIWSCFQCANKVVLSEDLYHGHIQITEQNEQLVHWVATWLQVPEGSVKVSIDG